MSAPPRDFTEWMRLMERKVMLANRSGQANLARSLQAEMVKVRNDMPDAADTRIPAAPIELTIQTSVRTSDTGRPYSEVAIDFADVTVATDATPIDVASYELWGRDESTWNGQGEGPAFIRLTTALGSAFLSGPFRPGAVWRFKVRAIGVNMLVPGLFSADQLVTMGVDTTPPAVPPNPDLYQELGVVGVRWDGLAANDAPMAPDFSHVEVAMGVGSAPTDLLPEVFLGGGTIFVTGLPYGEQRFFRMRSVDWSGNASVWSGSESISRTPLVSGDISGLDVTIQEQTEAAQAAEANAVQAAADAAASQTAALNSASAAAASQTAADAAAADAAASQSAADQVAADAALVQAAADAAAADAAAAQAAADQSAADAAQAALDAADAALAAQTAQEQLEAAAGAGGGIIYGDTPPTAEQQTVNHYWLKEDGSLWRWDEGVQDWTAVTDQALIDLGVQVDAAKDAAEAAEANAASSASAATASASTATAAQTAANTSASAASAAQTAASNAQSAAAASAATANEAQAEAEAAQAAATASANAAAASQAAAEQAAIDAGSSSAAALQAEQNAEAANLAADAAVDAVNAYIVAGDTMVVNGNFDAPITSPPLGWPNRTLTYNEASTSTARSGSQVLRATPTTGTVAYAYTDWIAANTDQIIYVEYFVRLREALKAGNSAQQLGVYYSWTKTDDSTASTSVYQNNGAPAVTLASLSTSAWTKVATTYKVTTADVKLMRFGPRIPVVTTGGQNFEIDDFRVVDITAAQAALDAAAAAQATATAANTLAGTANSTANSALSAATHNAKNLFSVDPPSGTAPLGTIWFQIDGTGKAIGQWQQTAGDAVTDGGTWAKRDIRSEMIANLDVAKLVGGFIDATHIETETLTVGAQTLGDKLAAHDTAATTVSDWNDGTGGIDAAAVTGTLATGAIPNLPATKITSGTFSGVVVPTGVLSGTISNAQVASGIDPSKLTGTGAIPVAAVPSIPATKVTSGTFAGVTMPTSLLSGTVSNSQVASGIDPNKLTGTGTVPTAAVPALDAAKITTGTLPGTVTVPGGNVSGAVASATSATSATNATNVTGSIGGSVTVPGGQVSGAIPTASVPALDAAKITTGTLPAAVGVPGASVTGTVPVAAVPSIPATKVTSGTFAGVTLPTTLLSGTVTNAQVATGLDPNKLTGTGTVPTAAVPALDAAKITTGTLPGTVAVPGASVTGTVANATAATTAGSATTAGTATNATNVTGSIGGSVSVPATQLSGTAPLAAIPALPTSQVTNLDTSLASNATAAAVAQAMASYSANPSFDDWTSTWPASYTAYSTVVPTKDTTNKKIGAQGARFVTDAVTSAGMQLNTLLAGAAFPDLTYYTVEVAFMLNSGTLSGAEVLIDWAGYTNYRAGVVLSTAVPAPVIGKWYKVVATIARPATGGGAWTAMDGYLMANHNSLGATRAVKDITFDWFNVRPSTDEEVKAYLAKQKVDSWASPSDVTYIDGGKLYTDSVKSLQIDTNDLVADSAFIGSLRTVVLTADSINATMVAAGAITSKHTITGALFQTTATALRGVKMDGTGLNAWDSTGVSTFQVDAATGYARIAGRYYSGAPGTGGVGIIPAVDSYNLKQVAILFSANGSYGSTNAGMWVDDTAGTQVLSLRGHNSGDVEIKSQNLQMNVANGRVGNFSNWAVGDASVNGNVYLPHLSINPVSGTGWFRITNAPTVASAANLVIATTPAGVLYKSTSSLKYKADVQDWTPGMKALELKPRTWVARNPIDAADPFQRYYGFIAEEVNAILPELVTLNEFDEPDGLQYDRFAAALIPVLKNVVDRLIVLEGNK